MKQANILIVDDELFFRELYREQLSEDGYRVDVCEDGETAIQRIAEGGIDLVLTDMVMPAKDGLAVLKAARSMLNSPEVILMTGHASIETAIAALKNGAHDYLLKPFDVGELRHLVRNCIDQRRLLDENQQLKSQIQLFQSGQDLASLIDLELLLPQALERLLAELGGGTGFGFLLDQSSGPVFHGLVGIESVQARDLPEQLFDLFESTVGFTRLSGAQCEHFSSAAMSFSAIGLLPLKVDDELRGGIVVMNAPRLSSFKGSTCDAVHYLSEQIVISFNNACRYQSAQDLMHTDDLTGLYNHRYLQMALDHEVRRSLRYGLQFSLLFLDLDHFKGVNDNHGHMCGSAALREVGVLLRQCVREVDTLFRFGGDEFAAILVDADANTARAIAERIRKVIDTHVFLQDMNTPCHLTVTAGYATFPSDATNQKQLLDLADQAMYAGKRVRNVIRGVTEIDKG
ncbi:MAG: diguanylate cyclase response regulator [Desulfuromonas sp.]|nr:MAG: diguanylate cyclase response regulator [Desulfuromonas sp.]